MWLLGRFWLTLTCLLAAANFVPAQAPTVEFSSSSPNYTGTVTQTGANNYKTYGISVHNQNGPYGSPSAVPFTLAFDTSAGTISINGTGIYSDQHLIGTISGHTTNTSNDLTTIVLNVFWTSLPTSVQTKLGTRQDYGMVSSVYVRVNANTLDLHSVDIPLMMATPESKSILLLGSGLVAVGCVLRRRLRFA